MSRADYLAHVSGKTKKPAVSAKDSGLHGCVQSVPIVPQRAKKASKTNSLTKAIIGLLAAKGCHAWRQNNGGQWDAKIKAFRSGSSTPGISDVLGYHKATGRIIAVEVKSKTDRLSEAQTAFLAGIEAAGGFACEGRSVEQVLSAFDLWCAKH